MMMCQVNDRRECHRVSVDGKAYWSVGRSESSSRVRNLSLGGAAITGPLKGLHTGAPIQVTMAFGDTTIESLSAELVHVGEDALGLRFLELSGEQHKQLVDLVLDHW